MKLGEIRNYICADSIGRKRNGNFMFRRSFFYTMGKDADGFKSSVVKDLTDANIKHEVVDYGEHWASFRGGASIAQGSHWYVEVKIVEQERATK